MKGSHYRREEAVQRFLVTCRQVGRASKMVHQQSCRRSGRCLLAYTFLGVASCLVLQLLAAEPSPFCKMMPLPYLRSCTDTHTRLSLSRPTSGRYSIPYTLTLPLLERLPTDGCSVPKRPPAPQSLLQRVRTSRLNCPGNLRITSHFICVYLCQSNIKFSIIAVQEDTYTENTQ